MKVEWESGAVLGLFGLFGLSAFPTLWTLRTLWALTDSAFSSLFNSSRLLVLLILGNTPWII